MFSAESDRGELGREQVGEGRAHHGQALKAEPSPITELPPRFDLFDDEDTLEADPERAFFVKTRFVRGDVPGKEGRVCQPIEAESSVLLRVWVNVRPCGDSLK